jgi:hypothetical protein
MNTTLSNTAVNTWKRIKLQYISVVCGFAIAASAAGALAWQGGAATTPSSPARASLSAPRSTETPSLVIFIAGSQQQADDHAASIRQDLDPAWFDSFSFVVVTSADEEVALLETQLEQMLVGSRFEVVDLRGR